MLHSVLPCPATPQVLKAVKTRKARAVVVAPNIDSIEGEGGQECPIAAVLKVGAGGGLSMRGLLRLGSLQLPTSMQWCLTQALLPLPPLPCPLPQLAAEGEVPVVFALSRQRMGKIFGQRKRASAFALMDVGGADDLFRQLLALADAGRLAWEAARQGGQP